GPGIGPRLDGAKGIASVLVGDRASATAEIRIERRQIAVLLVPVAAAGIGLPELDQRSRYAEAALVHKPAVDDDALAERCFARPGEIVDQVVVQLAEQALPEYRPGYLRQRVVEGDQGALRRTQDRCLVGRRQRRR